MVGQSCWDEEDRRAKYSFVRGKSTRLTRVSHYTSFRSHIQRSTFPSIVQEPLPLRSHAQPGVPFLRRRPLTSSITKHKTLFVRPRTSRGVYSLQTTDLTPPPATAPPPPPCHLPRLTISSRSPALPSPYHHLPRRRSRLSVCTNAINPSSIHIQHQSQDRFSASRSWSGCGTFQQRKG